MQQSVFSACTFYAEFETDERFARSGRMNNSGLASLFKHDEGGTIGIIIMCKQKNAHISRPFPAFANLTLSNPT